MIRPCQTSDAAAICAIYNEFVRDTIVTFEETPVSENDMAQRIRTIAERLPWFVWEQDGSVLGYAYAAPWMTRSAYRRSVETTVYISPGFARQGIGTRLYRVLIDELRDRELHCAVGGIALPNPASIALHEKLGYRNVGRVHEVGFKFGQWIDVGYWQLML